jgi:ankyrin repeat protein
MFLLIVTTPTRKLGEHPGLERLEREAKELLEAFLAGDSGAKNEVSTHSNFTPQNEVSTHSNFSLSQAQFVLARAYGFDSWPKLKLYVDGANMARLAEAVRANDLDKVRTILKTRPELVKLHMAENNEHQALHYAVYGRSPEMVRLLMQHGADARIGIYPHRDATSALTIATERGYDEIVAIILEEEKRRPSPRPASHRDDVWPAELGAAFQAVDEARVIAVLEADPSPIHVPSYFMTPLHGAAALTWERLAVWLLDHGADVNFRDGDGPTPLEIVGHGKRGVKPERVAPFAALLRSRGAEMTPRAAVKYGEAEWLRARHAEGKLENRVPAGQGSRGLLEIAVTHDQPEILKLLLDLGFTPDEPALRECVKLGRTAMATLLIERGAELTAPVAVALGRGEWLRARHSEGKLEDVRDEEGGLISVAGRSDRADMLALLLDLGFDADEPYRMEWMDADQQMYSAGAPLRWCAGHGKLELAKLLLDRGANPNAWDYSGPPIWPARRERDDAMVALLESRGAVHNPTTVGNLRDVERARRMFEEDAAGTLRTEGFWEHGTLAQLLLGSGANGGSAEIVRMALERIDWPRDDVRWRGPLGEPLAFYHEIPWIKSPKWPFERGGYFECFRLILERCDPNLPPAGFGQTMLHEVAAMRDWITDEEVVQFATALLDAGARTDVRDDLLKSTPLGWACRWGRAGMVKLLLERGVDAVEADAGPWARPRAWAEKMKRRDVLAVLTESL